MNKYDEISPASNWLGKLEIVEMLIKYYSKKFKNSCIFQFQRVNLYTYEYNNEKKDYDFTPMYIYDKFLRKNKNDTVPIMQIKQNIRNIVSNISKCIQEKGKNVSIAILYSFEFLEDSKRFAHENLLIFKPYNNTLEWFEPHGHTFMTKDNKVNLSNNILMKFLIKCLEEDQRINTGKIKFIKPSDVCPVATVGLQVKEYSSKLPDLSNGGYCVLWSVLIMKLSLKYPYKPVNTIVRNLLEEYDSSDKLRKLMYAFSNEISDILFQYYKMTLNEIIEKLD